MPERHVRRALQVTTGFRLRWLSERGCSDRACTGRGWGMLKRVPLWGREGLCGPVLAWCSCPVAGMVTLSEMSCRRGLQATIRAEFIGAGCASHRKIGIIRCTLRSRKPPAAGCRSNVASLAAAPTHHPELEPASASTDDHDTLDRSDPAPIGIEAGIPSPPAKHAAHDARARRSSTDAAIKHLTTIPINPHRNALLLVKSAFAYFSGACEK